MPWVCLLGFVRITTHPRVFEHPLRVEQATEALDALLAHPSVEPVNPTAAHPAILSRLLHEAGTAGNLTTDARIAAIAIERDARVATFDRNLARFGVRVVVPE